MAATQIVIIDDDRINNFICENILSEYDRSKIIKSFSDPELGFNYILQNRDSIDLILLDLNMPVYDGWDVLDILVENKVQVPVIILTSSINNEDREKTGNYPIVKAFIAKPASIVKLKEYL
ncbi:MAG: response regulator [Cytophagales bacterium]|nr:response regulator [Cytophagales bacterium]